MHLNTVLVPIQKIRNAINEIPPGVNYVFLLGDSASCIACRMTAVQCINPIDGPDNIMLVPTTPGGLVLNQDTWDGLGDNQWSDIGLWRRHTWHRCRHKEMLTEPKQPRKKAVKEKISAQATMSSSSSSTSSSGGTTRKRASSSTTKEPRPTAVARSESRREEKPSASKSFQDTKERLIAKPTLPNNLLGPSKLQPTQQDPPVVPQRPSERRESLAVQAAGGLFPSGRTNQVHSYIQDFALNTPFWEECSQYARSLVPPPAPQEPSALGPWLQGAAPWPYTVCSMTGALVLADQSQQNTPTQTAPLSFHVQDGFRIWQQAERTLQLQQVPTMGTPDAERDAREFEKLLAPYTGGSVTPTERDHHLGQQPSLTEAQVKEMSRHLFDTPEPRNSDGGSAGYAQFNYSCL